LHRIILIIRQKIFSIVMLAIALLSGIFIYFYVGYLKSDKDNARDAEKVLLAVEDISEGDVIDGSSITTQMIPQAISSKSYDLKEEYVIGKIATEDIAKGEILTREGISGFEETGQDTGSLSLYIPEYLKAVTVPIDYYGDTSLIKKGDVVDIISVYYDEKNDSLISEIILHSKELIATSSSSLIDMNHEGGSLILDSFESPGLAGQSNGPGSIIATFFLDDDEVKKVFLSLNKGVLNLAICPRQSLEIR